MEKQPPSAWINRKGVKCLPGTKVDRWETRGECANLHLKKQLEKSRYWRRQTEFSFCRLTEKPIKQQKTRNGKDKCVWSYSNLGKNLGKAWQSNRTQVWIAVVSHSDRQIEIETEYRLCRVWVKAQLKVWSNLAIWKALAKLLALCAHSVTLLFFLSSLFLHICADLKGKVR